MILFARLALHQTSCLSSFGFLPQRFQGSIQAESGGDPLPWPTVAGLPVVLSNRNCQTLINLNSLVRLEAYISEQHGQQGGTDQLGHWDHS
jgi:hypothetical protein